MIDDNKLEQIYNAHENNVTSHHSNYSYSTCIQQNRIIALNTNFHIFSMAIVKH